ncbi:MAG: EAL domain-containing protein [Halorhodospira sp.]
MQTPPPEQLYAEVCRIVVDYGGLVLAWVGLVGDAGEVAPVVCHGAGDVPADELGQRLAAAESRTEGLVHMAVRCERRVLIPHLQQDPRMHPHREVAAEWGLGAAGAFPIHRGGTVVGSLNIYAADPAFFAEQEGVVALFDELVADIGAALDDFGTGYSSLAYLQELPLDYLKVDRSFVQRIGETRASEGIIEAVLAMARHLGLRVIAEGVETAEQAAFLQGRGCEVGQGFYWAKPLPAAEIEPLLRGRA